MHILLWEAFDVQLCVPKTNIKMDKKTFSPVTHYFKAEKNTLKDSYGISANDLLM